MVGRVAKMPEACVYLASGHPKQRCMNRNKTAWSLELNEAGGRMGLDY